MELPPVRPTAAERALVSVAVVGLFLMAALVTTNVLSRWIGRAIIPDDVLLVQELMVLVILLPLGFITAQREHIRVDLFAMLVPMKGKLLLALLEHLVGVLFLAILTWAAWRGFLQTWQTQDYYAGTLDIPMWVGHLAFLFGVSLFLVRLIAMLAHDLRRLF